MIRIKMENRGLRKLVKQQEDLIRKLSNPPKEEVVLGEPSVIKLAGSWDGAGGADDTILDFPEDDIEITLPANGDDEYSLGGSGTSQDLLNTPQHDTRFGGLGGGIEAEGRD